MFLYGVVFNVECSSFKFFLPTRDKWLKEDEGAAHYMAVEVFDNLLALATSLTLQILPLPGLSLILPRGVSPLAARLWISLVET